MPVPPHITSFQKFNDKTPNHLVASVAFGQFMASERAWVEVQNPEPTVTKCANYHADFLTDREITRFIEAAEITLNEFGNKTVERVQAEIFAAAARQHKGPRWWGVIEATGGAFLWTALLIVVSFVLQYAGVDLEEIFKRVVGVH